MICTSGIWTVRQGREDEFARRWQESVDETALENPELSFRLFRDHRDPRRFVSLDEGWRTIEQVEAVRSTPAYQDSIASLWRLLESGEASTLELVVEVS
jgi:quinol monooxygenase YgiN